MKATELRIGNYVNHDGRLINIELKHFQDILLYPNEQRKYAPIPLTEEWLLKLGFDDWGLGTLYCNEHEKYQRYVLHNVLDGTSNFEVHFIESWHGGKPFEQFVISCDEDERVNFGEEIRYVHHLQNLYHSLTQNELCIS